MGKGTSAQAIHFGFHGPFGKNRGYKISAKRLYRKTAPSGVDCHRSILSLGKLGAALRTVFDNIQEPRSSVDTERVRRLGV